MDRNEEKGNSLVCFVSTVEIPAACQIHLVLLLH